MGAGHVVGREAELAAIRSLVSVPRGGLVLTGEAGIGKTVLWELAVELAAESGWLVLRHRSVRAEAGCAFSGLADLLGPVVGEVLPELAAPRRRALEFALLLTEPAGPGPPDAHAVGLAVLDALRVLAARAPVAVAIDDVQWLDASSASVLAVALRRLRDEPVTVLATRRGGAGAAEGQALPDVDLELMPLDPLDLTGVHRLLRDRLGLELARPTLAAIHRASGGNPYFALELARGVTPGQPLSVPESLRDLLGARVDGLPPEMLDVLLDAAALAQPTVALVAGGRERPEDAYAALATAVEQGLVRFEDDRIVFAHPLLASLCYDRAPPWDRRAAHRRLAGLVRDPEERARHLALAAEDAADADLADELERVGRRAASRGATVAAAELVELAVRHTPADQVEELWRRRLALGNLHRLAADLERAVALYRDLLTDLPQGHQRAEVLYAMAISQQEGATTRAVLTEALEQVGDDDALAAQILAGRAMHQWLTGQSDAGLADARAGLERAERIGVPRLAASAIGTVAALETWRLERTPGLLERGMELERGLAEPLWFTYSPAYWSTIGLILDGGADEARPLVGDLAAEAEARGDEHTRTFMAGLLINLERFAGRPGAATVNAEIARDMAEQVADMQLRSLTATFSAGAFAEAGRLEDARAAARDGLELARHMGDLVQEAMLLGTLGQIELVRGNAAEAHAILDELPDRLLRCGHLHPAGTPWPDAIEAAIAVGRLDRAQDLLRKYEPLAERASCWARASAARCAGVLALAEGNDRGAVAASQRALEEEAGMHPLERGRILTGLGFAHRHARRSREARTSLEEAVAVLDEVGAGAWRDRAIAELGRVSGRRGYGDELTPSERRVAELAAEGHQNKEIAAELFLTVATVEAHLTRIYRKLRVRSRTELARELRAALRAASNV